MGFQAKRKTDFTASVADRGKDFTQVWTDGEPDSTVRLESEGLTHHKVTIKTLKKVLAVPKLGLIDALDALAACTLTSHETVPLRNFSR
jgi:hypothetical protein